MSADLFGNFSVLFLEGSDALQGLFGKWLSGVTTRFASSVDEIEREFNSTVAVTCLSQSALGENTQKIRNHILTTNPFCQLVLILPRSAFLTPEEDNYDACIQRPVFKEELQTTVKNCLISGVYAQLLQEFYHLNTELHCINQSDTDADTDTAKIYERFHRVRQQLHNLQSKLDIEDISSISRSIERHKQYLREPVHDDSTPSTKYHPKRCPQCKLPWGVNHGNELRHGFERVAAHVWQCTRCENIIQGLGNSNRRVNH